MQSLSYDLLQAAHNLPSCYYHYHSAANHRDRDDSIPRETQRHLAGYLSPHPNPELELPNLISSQDLFQLFSHNEYINQKRKILSRTRICPKDPPASLIRRPSFTSALDAQSGHSYNSGSLLHELPAELLCMIKDELEPSDLVCLGLASRHLFHAVDYQLVDIRNVMFAGGQLWDVLHQQKLRHKLARQRYAVTKRLDRDRIERLERSRFWRRGGGDELACGVCVKLHHRRWFSVAQRMRPARERRCLAAEASVRICEHWSENLVSLRKMREEAVCDVKRQNVCHFRSCEHPDHTNNENNGFGEPHFMDLGSGFAIDRSMVLMRSPDRDLITENLVQEALRYRADVEICSHVKLGDSRVLQAITKRTAMRLDDLPEHLQRLGFHLPEFESSACDKCGRAWQFSIFDHGKRDSFLRYALRLSVDEQLLVAKDPWSEEWLNKIGSADTLRRIKAMVW